MTTRQKTRSTNPFIAVASLATAFAVIAGISDVEAAEWRPNRPITWVVNAGEGGGSDTAARAAVRAVESVSDVKIVVENVSGSGGRTGLAEWMRRPTDGHTLMLGSQSTIAYIVQGLVDFSIGDIEAVAMMQDGPATLLGQDSDPRFADFDAMVAYMKAGNPLKVAVYSDNRDFFDMWMLLAIEKAKGVKFNAVPYPAASDRYSALLRGEVDLLSQRLGDVMPMVQAGQMKPLLVNRAAIASEFDGLPTFQKKGIAFEIGFWRGIWMRSGNPPESIEFMADLFAKALASPAWKAFEEKTHYKGGFRNRPDFAAYLKEEHALITRMLK